MTGQAPPEERESPSERVPAGQALSSGQAPGAGQDRRQELLRRLAALPPARREALRRAMTAAAAGGLPLSSGQERLWFLNRFDPADSGNHILWCVRLRGPVDPGGLAAALTAVAGRHEVLRARYRMDGDRPVQSVPPPEPVVLERADGGADPDGAVLALFHRPFDLEHDPPMRAALIRLEERHALLCIVLHHIAADGWSLNVLMRELGECYAAHREGRRPELPELPARYADFVAWERGQAERAGPARLAFWTERLAGAPVLDLPADHPRPPRWTGRGGRVDLHVPDAETTRFEQVARERRSTLFMALLAAFQATLGAVARQDDFCVGVPVAGRGRTEFAPLIGYFSNTIALRADLSGDPSFRELLGRVRPATLRALQHAEEPFERILGALRLPRDLSRPPLCQAMFNLTHNLPKDDLLRTEMGDLAVEAYPPPETGRTRAEISVDLYRGPEGLGGSLEYSSDLFTAGTARRVAAAFTGLVTRAGADPDLRLSALTGPTGLKGE
ncbi:condensation domain-containing protein [Planomonospora corallina]|uniref:Condensation domain-containing protein n=1 Tax=Planomonospora corallina TaxID=1806052 RepID=A0ABV8IFH9_9ACTN